MSLSLRSLFLGFCLLAQIGPVRAAFDLDRLMAELATHKGGQARFVEKRFMAVLDKPLVATGVMTFTPPDYLEKRTLKPKPETMVLDHDVRM